jgi:hypothetical protein
MAGPQNTSLTGNTHYGFEMGTEYRNSLFGPLGKIRFGYGTGKTNLNDAGTVKTLAYRALEADILLGLKVSLIPVAHTRIRPYVGLSGSLGTVQLTLASNNLESLQQTDIQFALGYQLSMGIELTPTKDVKSALHFFYEVQYDRRESSLAGMNSFRLESIRFLGGFGW